MHLLLVVVIVGKEKLGITGSACQGGEEGKPIGPFDVGLLAFGHHHAFFHRAGAVEEEVSVVIGGGGRCCWEAEMGRRVEVWGRE